MQDPIYEKLNETGRPSLTAASVLMLLATLGLWLSALLDWALPQESSTLAVNAAYYLPFVALPLALWARASHPSADTLRLNPPPLLALPAVAALAILSVYVASTLSALWAYGLDALGLHNLPDVQTPMTERELALAIISMAALPGVCEELLFRGVALSAWESRGTGRAIGVTAALFALMHGNLYGLPAYLLVGAVSGCVTFALDSVYAGIVYHTVYNAAVLTISYVLSSGAKAAAGSGMDARMLAAIALETAMMAGVMALLLAALRFRARRSGILPIPRVQRPLTGKERVALLAALAAMLVSNATVLYFSAQAAAG